MDIEKEFDFLVKDYGLTYKYQEFHNCYGGNWLVYTHSFYNSSGCFTIYEMPSRGELDFYYAQKFSNVLKELCERMIDISSIEKELWNKHTRIGCLKRPFFWWNSDRILKVAAEALNVHIKKYGEFFGVSIMNTATDR